MKGITHLRERGRRVRKKEDKGEKEDPPTSRGEKGRGDILLGMSKSSHNRTDMAIRVKRKKDV